MGPRKKFRNRQAWLEMTWLSCNRHSRPLTKHFPPMEAATAADLAQAFEPVLRRLRQQPTSPPRKKFELFCDCPKSARIQTQAQRSNARQESNPLAFLDPFLYDFDSQPLLCVWMRAARKYLGATRYMVWNYFSRSELSVVFASKPSV